MMIKNQETEQISQQQDPLSLYAELYLIAPGWATALFKEVFEDHTRLSDSKCCVVGEAHRYSELYHRDYADIYCEDCSNYSQSIYVASKSSIKSKVDGTYNRDKFHAEISKFIQHFKAKHGGQSNG